MKVNLISYKTSEDSKNVQELIYYCARVSNPGNQDNTETNEKLIGYLIKNNHSPFEMVSVCLYLETRYILFL